VSRPRYDVCAAVVSDLAFDARVWKEVRSLGAAGYRVALLGCRYDIDAPRWRSEDGVDVFEVPFGTRAKVSLAGRARTLLRLSLEILRTRARAYHAHNVHVGPQSWLAAKLRRARLVYDAHELYGELHGGFLTRMAVRLERPLERLMAGADAVITTNDSRAAKLVERYHPARMVTLQNVPRRRDEVAPLDPGYGEGRILLYQGGIYGGGRSFEETVVALTMLPEDVTFALVGFGREGDLQRLREVAEAHGVSARVRLLPPRPFDELVDTAAAAHVGLVPIKPTSLNNYLGDTNKLFEYLMAGIPVVASDIPEVRRVVELGRPPVGEIFDPYDPESIAGAVSRVFADEETYAARRREARRLALEQLNWEREEVELLSTYRALGITPEGVR
jgi:glycosyltransferase involved in cell wall biosynthesis